MIFTAETIELTPRSIINQQKSKLYSDTIRIIKYYTKHSNINTRNLNNENKSTQKIPTKLTYQKIIDGFDRNKIFANPLRTTIKTKYQQTI